jgi:hypothetical protein
MIPDALENDSFRLFAPALGTVSALQKCKTKCFDCFFVTLTDCAFLVSAPQTPTLIAAQKKYENYKAF